MTVQSTTIGNSIMSLAFVVVLVIAMLATGLVIFAGCLRLSCRCFRIADVTWRRAFLVWLLLAATNLVLPAAMAAWSSLRPC
jgi:hypothetical protein